MNPSPEPRVEFRAYLPSDHESLVQLWHDCDLLRPWTTLAMTSVNVLRTRHHNCGSQSVARYFAAA